MSGYDAWGACTVASDTSVCSIAAINPFRYRGYYYDAEIGMYYLQSRYYNPVVGRFINADEFVRLDFSLGLGLFLYCENSPVIYKDPTGYKKIVAIYYNYPGTDFKEQAYNSHNFKAKDADLIPVVSIKDFKSAWSSVSRNVEYLFLFLHGGTGRLYFKNETMTLDQIRKLPKRKVRRWVYLYSCYGGAGDESNNVAWAIAKLTDSKVSAFTKKVSYSRVFGRYIARVGRSMGCKKTFYYQRKYIWWGAIVAKSYIGE